MPMNQPARRCPRKLSRSVALPLALACISTCVAFSPRVLRRPLTMLSFFGAGASAATPDIPPSEQIGLGARGQGPRLGKQSTAWDALDERGLPGKTAIVTGANCGIGYYTALALAYGGANVVLACRDMKKCEDARGQMKASLVEAGKSGDGIECAKLDLSSLKSVDQFAAKYRAGGKPLNLLCLNAGVMAIPEYRASADGYEMQFATNHLGHFALTTALMDTLEKSAPARVVTLASNAHQAPSNPLDVGNLPPSKETYADWGAYQQSKLENILFSNELARRFKEKGVAVTSNAVHPGVIPTDLGRQQLLKGKLLLNAFKDRTVEQGAATSVYCLTSADLEGATGNYFTDCAQKEPAPYAKDMQAAAVLWKRSEELVQQALQAA